MSTMADETDVNLARVLDEQGSVKRFKGPNGQKSRVIIVKDQTRIPLILLSLSVAAAIGGGGFYAFQKAKLVEEQRENEKRFIAALETKNIELTKQAQPAEKNNVETSDAPPTQKRRVVTLNPRPVQKPSESARLTGERTIPSITGVGTVPAFTVETLPPPNPAEVKESVQTD